MGDKAYIPPFQPETIVPDTIMMFCGPRGTGKTVTMRNILMHIRRHVYACMVQTPTRDTRDALEPHIPWTCIHDDFDKDAIGRVMDSMRTLCNAERERAAQESRSPERRFVLVLLDDCMADKSALRHKAIRDIFYNGRHEDIMFMNIQQELMDMPNNLRSNVNYMFATRTEDPKLIEKLHTYFFQTAFPRYADFRKAFMMCTENYGVMVLDRTIRTGNPFDQVFVFRSKTDIPSFRVGHPDIWTLHQRYCKDRKEENGKLMNFIEETVRRKFTAREAEEERYNPITADGPPLEFSLAM